MKIRSNNTNKVVEAINELFAVHNYADDVVVFFCARYNSRTDLYFDSVVGKIIDEDNNKFTIEFDTDFDEGQDFFEVLDIKYLSQVIDMYTDDMTKLWCNNRRTEV